MKKQSALLKFTLSRIPKLSPLEREYILAVIHAERLRRRVAAERSAAEQVVR
jgi:hypothetical protein